MKIYKVDDLENPIESLNLGTVPAGETREFHYFLVNDTEAFLDKMEISTDNSEIKIISVPVSMKANEKANFFIQWSPSVTLKQGLKANLKIKAIEIWS